MNTLTTRELRRLAAILDGLNKARAINSRMGVPTTPDVLTARFPTGHVFVVRWTKAVQGSDHTRQRTLEHAARHRDGYQIDLATEADPATAVHLQDPQPAKRGGNIRVDLPAGPDAFEAVRDAAARHAARHPGNT